MAFSTMRPHLWALAGLAVLGFAAPAAAEYPEKPIRIVVPFPPGGATDTLARQLAGDMSTSMGVPVVVDNRAGAGGITGAEIAANADPDGYTIMLTSGGLVQLPNLHADLPFDPLTDFAPLSEIVRTYNVLVVPVSSGITTFEQFVERMKAEPGQHSYGTYGAGSTAHIYGELLNQRAGLDLTHIPYRGSGPLMTDVLAEMLSLGMPDNVSVRPHMESGRFVPIAVSGTERSSFLPDVPTLAELGYEDFEAYSWVSAFAPAGVPDEILDRLSDELVKASNSPAMKELSDNLGLLLVGSDRQTFAASVKEDFDGWKKLIAETGVTLE